MAERVPLLSQPCQQAAYRSDREQLRLARLPSACWIYCPARFAGRAGVRRC